MGKPIGLPKSGGRRKGSKNKITGSTRAWISNLLEDNRETVVNDLAQLEPFQRLQMLEKFMSYTLPKLSSIQAEINLNDLSDDDLSEIIEQITKNIDE
jgi:hypothetical protein